MKTNRFIHLFIFLITSVAIINFFYKSDSNKIALPKMLVIGDSISFQYRPFLVNSLANKVDVQWLGKSDALEINGGDSKRPIELAKSTFIENWLSINDGDWDIITFNFGLHDLKFDSYVNPIDPDKFKQYSSPQEYKMNLRYIIERLRKTGARLVWVTTTPGKGSSESTRTTGDHEVYNKYATELITAYPEILSVDLYRSNIANLNQQDAVHYTEDAGKKRAASLISKTILKILNQLSAATIQSTSVPVKGVVESQLEQAYFNGNWIDIWRTNTTYPNKLLTERVGSFNSGTSMKRAYKTSWVQDPTGKVIEKTHLLWIANKWENYKKESFTRDENGNIINEFWTNWENNTWKNTWRFDYTYDSDNTVLTKNSYIDIHNNWRKNLEESFTNVAGRVSETLISAKLGSVFTPRYKLQYTYDAQGKVNKLYSERFTFGKWEKSAEFAYSTETTTFSTTLFGFYKGKPNWLKIYTIDGKYNTSGSTIQIQTKMKLSGLTSADIPLYKDNMTYDIQGNLNEKIVQIAIGDTTTNKYTLTPAVKTTYTYH